MRLFLGWWGLLVNTGEFFDGEFFDSEFFDAEII